MVIGWIGLDSLLQDDIESVVFALESLMMAGD